MKHRIWTACTRGARTLWSDVSSLLRVGLLLSLLALAVWAVAPRPALAGVGKIIALINQLHGAPLAGTAPSDNNIMTYDSATGQWGPEAPAASAQSVALLDGSEHTDTAADAATRGSVIIGNSTPAWDELEASAGILTCDGTDVSWAANDGPNVVDTLAATLGAGAATGGTSLSLTSGDDLTSAAELDITAGAGTNDLTLNAGAGATDSNGGQLNCYSGAGNGTGASGDMTIRTGAPGVTGDSGAVAIGSADGGATSGASGNLNANSGDTTSGNTGSVALQSGNAGGAGNSGAVTVDSGTAGGTTGAVNIGNTNASDVNIGQGTATVDIGDDTTGAVTLDSGSGITIGTNATFVQFAPAIAGTAGTLTVGTSSSHPTIPDDTRLQFGSAAGGGDVRMSGELTTLTDNSATTVLSVTMGDGDVAGITIHYYLESSDGADSVAEVGVVQIALIDDAGGVVASTPGEVSVQINSTAGDSLTTDWSVVTTDDQSIEIQLDADTVGLTPTTHQVRWVATYPSNVTITVP